MKLILVFLNVFSKILFVYPFSKIFYKLFSHDYTTRSGRFEFKKLQNDSFLAFHCFPCVCLSRIGCNCMEFHFIFLRTVILIILWPTPFFPLLNFREHALSVPTVKSHFSSCMLLYLNRAFMFVFVYYFACPVLMYCLVFNHVLLRI